MRKKQQEAQGEKVKPIFWKVYRENTKISGGISDLGHSGATFTSLQRAVFMPGLTAHHPYKPI